MAEIVMWQYRWLNPANDPNQPPSMLEWKQVQPWSRIQTMEQRIEELRDFRYDGKPAYEVRALGVVPSGVDGPPKDEKTGWPPPELMQDDSRDLSKALSDPIDAALRRKPVSITAGVTVDRHQTFCTDTPTESKAKD